MHGVTCRLSGSSIHALAYPVPTSFPSIFRHTRPTSIRIASWHLLHQYHLWGMLCLWNRLQR
ncbi:hypothetical protein BDR06DRAFT_172756 [Suillus hirtellus]|nr:hypothetical protein BDR06DRAFT_172756 [Suillus hirtellus]